MTYTVKTVYDRGFVVEELDNGTDPCESWILFPAENLWHPVLRGFLYVICISYFFIGIAIASDIFMSSIEVITSKKRNLVKWDAAKKEKIEYEVLIWNETVANLTLMALGSSAPEILLATIETVMNLGSDEVKDSLGTFTIIGSAAFNLLVITSICIVSVPPPNPKSIREFSVFLLTATWSIWAYVWMLLVVKYISPDKITPWEAWVTLLFMPVFVFMSYCQHNGWWCKKSKVDQGEDDHMRILNQRGRAGSFTGHIIPGKELRVLEQEKSEKTTSTRLSVISLNSETYSSKKKRVSQYDTLPWGGSASDVSQHTVDPNHRDGKESDTVIEMTDSSSEAGIEKHVKAPQAFARARFRHAVVRSLTGQAHRAPRRTMADIVDASMKLEKNKKDGKKPEGDLMGKFTFSSDRYAVLESGGFLEVDILFHRNIPAIGESSTVANGDAVTFRNGDVKILPDVKPVPGVVSIEYETREGTAKHGKDFKYTADTVVFKESEYKKTISIPIINDNQFESDVIFYIVLKNATGGAGVGDPSVAMVTIVDDDDPGEFQFEKDHCTADLLEGKLSAKIIREKGFDGIVKLEYATIDGTATGGADLNKKCDYVTQKGELEFSHAETTKVISININKNAEGPKNFIITLKNPSLGAKIGTRSAVVCNITKDELGDRLADLVGPDEEEEVSWRGQFVSAMQVGGGTDEDGNDVQATWVNYLMHFLTFFWKLIGACVPPTKYLGAWPTFVLSMAYIGVLVLVVEQLGHLIGCVIDMPTSVTGITLIALGTSLPDTFASRTAAQQDEHADAAIGNVTGSNCVNVFLGLGIPWVLSTMYHLAKGTEFKVQSDNLTQSVIVFSTLGAVCIIVLLLRRKFVGGELGGKNPFVRWGTSIFLFVLWVVYIVIVSLKATDRIIWEL